MKHTDIRFDRSVRRPDSRRELRRAWDRVGALINKPLAAKPLVEDGVNEYEEALTARNAARETADLDAAFAALPVVNTLECANCGNTFDGTTVPVGSLACPHCGNIDW